MLSYMIVLPVLLLTQVAQTAQAANEPAKPCQLARGQSGSIPAWASSAFVSSNCSGLQAIMQLWSGRSRPTGRELEASRGLDEAGARKELASAQRDKEYVAGLASDQARETDPARRQFLQAAWLHEFGFYKARDLVLSQIGAAGAGK